MFDKIMNFKPLSGSPHPKAADRKVRMRNIFAAPLEKVTKELDDLKNILTPKNQEQEEFLDGALSSHFIFQHLDPKEKKILMDAMSLKTAEKGTTIIQQGEKGEFLYIIEEGSVDFIVAGKQVGSGERATLFGELSLLYDCPTAASVIATSDCKLWRVSQYIFRRIKAAHALSNDNETRNTITSIPFFKDLPDEYIHHLADSLLKLKFSKGDVLATKGGVGETLFIIKEGWIQGTDISVGTTKYADIRLGKGEYFGERPIVTGEPNPANVTALTDGTAWILTKERFQKVVGHLNLEEFVLKAQDKKLLMAIPLFAYSDIDTVEMELLADEIQEEEYQTGHVISKIGQFVVPAVYIVRSGKVVSQERLRIPVGGLLLFARFFSSLPFTFTVASYLTHADDFEWNRLKRLANR
jgi:CRP-like cAMP-binding protein